MKDITEDQEEAAFDPAALATRDETTAKGESRIQRSAVDIFSNGVPAEARKESKLPA